MQCFVYRSARKAESYLYVSRRDDFGAVPAPILAALQPLQFVLELTLAPERRLARVDAAEVRAALAQRGWFVQHPPAPQAPED
jgi:uncharacterized protein YcgL (UPF0745 family)